MFNVSFDAYVIQHRFNQHLSMLVESIRFRPGMDPRARSFLAWELLALNSRVFWEINESETDTSCPTMPECAD